MAVCVVYCHHIYVWCTCRCRKQPVQSVKMSANTESAGKFPVGLQHFHFMTRKCLGQQQNLSIIQKILEGLQLETEILIMSSEIPKLITFTLWRILYQLAVWVGILSYLATHEDSNIPFQNHHLIIKILTLSTMMVDETFDVVVVGAGEYSFTSS